MKLSVMVLVFAHIMFSQPVQRGIVFDAGASNADSLVDVIVEFREDPLFVARRFSVTAQSTDFYRNRFAEFSADLNGRLRTLGAVPMPQAAKKFYKAFFGAAVRVRQADVQLLRRLPYVKTVHPDAAVQAFLESSIPRLRIDTVWAIYGAKGDGVVVGVLDTGIDYMHPALGGGFGRGFRVAGGYDFVNGDDDPMDDNGHGTHVAGIIGADASSVIQGCAPRCTLVAYKVLDARGRGKESDIIDAIERTVDPDQDGSDSDRLDIVNLSLGSEDGDPDDAQSTAVDNAVRLGVTFCIAAGNSGRYSPVQGKEDNYYYTAMETIGSPGTARLAITVGAADQTDRLTEFSSKGPCARTFGIKPDILAPGSNIHSLAPGGGLAYKSGTSMACPMIAGVAALLKSHDHALTPQEIKSSIVTSSIDLGLRVMQQGAGRVDALRALDQHSFVTSTSLQFGFDDPSLTKWAKTETLTVINRHNKIQQYAFAFGAVAQGIVLEAEPQTFTLAPGASQHVSVSLTVNNAAVPVRDEDILVYEGTAKIAGTRDTLRIPWAFTRASQIMLSFTEADAIFAGSGDQYVITPSYGRYDSKIIWKDPLHAQVVGIFPGRYDFAVYYPSQQALIVKEGIQSPQQSQLQFSPQEARHTMSFGGVDHTGAPFAPVAKDQALLRVELPTSYPLFVPFASGQRSVRISPASGSITFQGIESAVDIARTGSVHLPQYPPFHGMSGDVTLTNDPSMYRKQTLRFRVPPGTDRAVLYSDIIGITTENAHELFNTVQVAADTVAVVNGTAPIDLYLMKPVDPVYSTSIGFHVNHSDIAANRIDLSTPYFSVINDSVMAGLPSSRSAVSVLSPQQGAMTIGAGPVHIVNLSYNNATGTSVQFDPKFRGPAFENRYTDVLSAAYTIATESGMLLREGKLADSRTPLPVQPGRYVISYSAKNYHVSNMNGTLSMRNAVDLRQPVPDPPNITSLALLDSRGMPTDNPHQREKISLRFSSKVYASPFQLPLAESTTVRYRIFGTRAWRNAPVALQGSNIQSVGSIFTADLTQATEADSTAIDLSVRLVDAYGNASELTLEPAFSIGRWRSVPVTGVDPVAAVPFAFGLDQNFPNPFNPRTMVRYEIGQPGRAELAVFDLLGRRVATIADGMHAAGRYTAEFDASRLASGMYICRLVQGGNTATKKMLVVR